MKYSNEKTDQYFRMYPKLQKWVNTCPCCGAKGYKPNMPDNVAGHLSMADSNIKRLLPPLEVDSAGYCLTCSRLLKR